MTHNPQQDNKHSRGSTEKKGAWDGDLFFDVFHKVNIGSLLVDPRSGRILDVNASFLSLTGYSPEQVRGISLESLPAFSFLCREKKIRALFAHNHKLTNLRTSFVDEQGIPRVFLCSTTPLNHGGKAVQLVTVNDISAEVNALEFQDLLFSRYRSIISHISTSVALLKVKEEGKRFIFIDFNKAAEKLEGIRKEEVVGKELLEVFPEMKKHNFPNTLKEVYRTGRHAFTSISFRDKEGKRHWRDNYIYKLTGDEILITYEDRTSEILYQREIRESEKRYRDLADMLPVVVFETDKDGKIIYANKMAMKMFRYTRKDIEGGIQVENMVIPEERLEARREIYRQIRGIGIHKSSEFTGLRKDGTTFPVDFKVSPAIKNGEFQGIRGILRDLTEEKAIQEQLKRDKIYLESLIEGAPEAIMQTYKDGTILRINKEFTRLFGYTEEEVKGLHVGEVLYGNNKKIKEEGLAVIGKIAQGKPQSLETIRYRKDGTVVPVSFLGSPIILDGKIIGVYGIYRNISERKKNERITETILNISTSALSTQTQNEFFDVIRHELSSIINTRNLFIALYNKEKDTLSFPLHLDEKDGNDTFREVSAKKTLSGYVIRLGKPVLLREKEINALEKEGKFTRVGTPSKIWMGVPLKVDQEIFGIISIQDYEHEKAFTTNDLKILRIISNQIALAIKYKRAQELMRIAKERAEENALFKEQFLSTMSHEIRTPLNAIIGMTRLLAKTDPTPGQQEYIQALEVSGNNLLRLINDILDFSKLEAGKMVIEEIEFSPVEQINALASSFRFIAEEKGLSFVTIVDERIPARVKGDPTRINQILTNLIGNAIKFTGEGSVTLALHLKKETGEHIHLEYSVSDTGIGIPANKLESIFESFTQAEKATTRKFGGTGLGLSISKKLAELLNTTIRVESEVNQGTTFSFILPLKKVKSSGKEQVRDNMEEIVRTLQGKRVLIAEDNALNRIVAIKSMKEWGMQIDQCENGEEAVRLVEEHDYDVVLMDLQMPVMDGYEATRAIRNMEKGRKRKTPIVALTASALMDIRTQAKEYNMDDILLKPFRPDDLARKLHGLIVKNRKRGK